MGFGGTRKFKTLNAARDFVNKARAKGLFVGEPEWDGSSYVVSVLTKRGTNPFFLKGL